MQWRSLAQQSKSMRVLGVAEGRFAGSSEARRDWEPNETLQRWVHRRVQELFVDSLFNESEWSIVHRTATDQAVVTVEVSLCEPTSGAEPNQTLVRSSHDPTATL